MARGREASRARSGGVALLSVMFILVLLTTLSVFMVEADHLMLRRASNVRAAEQGVQLAMGSEQWAMRVLQRDLADGETDHLGEDWNQLGPAVAVDDGTLSTRVADLQGLFNLNNLGQRDEVWYPAFRRLLRLLEIDEGLAEAVADWIDANQQRTHADGAEDLEYLLFDPPYRAANRPMVELGELRWVEGVTPEVMRKLAPFVTVIPDSRVTRINVNTCPPLLYQLLGDEMTAADAESLANARTDGGFDSVETFLQRPELAGFANITAEPMVTVESGWFRVRSEVAIGRTGMSMDSVVRRRRELESVEVVQRHRGYL